MKERCKYEVSKSSQKRPYPVKKYDKPERRTERKKLDHKQHRESRKERLREPRHERQRRPTAVESDDDRTTFQKFGCLSFRAFVSIGIFILIDSIILIPLLRSMSSGGGSIYDLKDLGMYVVGIFFGYKGWKEQSKLSPKMQTFWGYFGVVAFTCTALCFLNGFS